jgi:adenine/guanine phosphoribosyltransferase-like PRPP-binding protein
MILAIVESRNFKNFDLLKTCVNQIKDQYKITKIVSGSTRGADTLAEKYAEKYNIPLIVHKADWEKRGKSAGPMRNTLIVNDCD